MGLNGQPHSLTTLPRGKEPTVSIEKAPEPVWMFWRTENLLHLPGFEPHIVQPLA
jgi:hypothetical protein